MTPRRILLVGATSAIATAMCELYAKRGDLVCLAARNRLRAQVVADELSARHGAIFPCVSFDAMDSGAPTRVMAEAVAILGWLDVVIVAHGSLPSDERPLQEHHIAESVMVNGLSVITLLECATRYFAIHAGGTVAVISSVAGDRGRGSNYIYGASKSLVSAYASGLGQRLKRTNVKVVVIKPGLVDTPMTAGRKKGLLWSTPAVVAAIAVKAIDRGTPVVYAPRFWQPIMWLIKLIPERVFRRLPL